MGCQKLSHVYIKLIIVWFQQRLPRDERRARALPANKAV